MVREKRKAKRKRRNKCIFYVSIVGVVMIVAALISKSVWNHIREKDITVSEDGWVNVELKYLGSIKMRDLEIIGSAKPKHYKYSDGDLEYTMWLYKFWADQKSFQKDAEASGFYDADFDTEAAIQYEKGKQYVYCYGRKITWMQYSTSEKTVFENVPSRIGVDWEIPMEEYTIYVYEFAYDTEKNGHLADMEYE